MEEGGVLEESHGVVRMRVHGGGSTKDREQLYRMDLYKYV
jgi:hypothetical protein